MVELGLTPTRPGRHHPWRGPSYSPSEELDVKGLLVSALSGSEGGLLLFLAFSSCLDLFRAGRTRGPEVGELSGCLSRKDFLLWAGLGSATIGV